MTKEELEALRRKLTEIRGRAAAKLAEMKDGLAADVVKRIEDEHAALVREIETINAQIADGERKLATPPAESSEVARQAAAAERQRVLDINEACRIFAMADKAEDMIKRGITADAARGEIQTMLATRSQASRQQPHIQIGRDEGDTLRQAVESSIVLRANPQAFKPDDKRREMARNWRGMSLLEAGRSFLEEAHGLKLRGLSRRELAGVCLGLIEGRAAGMHSTSDFANILANVASSRLRDAYTAAPQNWKRFMRQSNNPDFKEKSVVQLSSAPAFKKVREGAEFTYGGLTDGVEKYALSTYGRIIAITRQTLINDDLGAFDRLPTLLGRAAADLESTTAWSVMLDNPTMSDTVALFDAAHGNLPTASAIDETNLGLARGLMRKQRSLAAKAADREYLNLSPAFLIVGPDKEVQAQKMLTAVTPSASSDVNVFQGSMALIVESRVTGNKWFLSADPATIDTIEYAYLEGEEGVYTEQRIGFEVDGIEIKGRNDFAAKAIDWRGLVYNSGA